MLRHRETHKKRLLWMAARILPFELFRIHYEFLLSLSFFSGNVKGVLKIYIIFNCPHLHPFWVRPDDKKDIFYWCYFSVRSFQSAHQS